MLSVGTNRDMYFMGEPLIGARGKPSLHIEHPLLGAKHLVQAGQAGRKRPHARFGLMPRRTVLTALGGAKEMRNRKKQFHDSCPACGQPLQLIHAVTACFSSRRGRLPMNVRIVCRVMLALAVMGWFGSSARAMNLYSVATGVYRGSTPETAEDFDRLKRMGIKTVLNLRRFDRNAIAREGQALSARGIRHIHVPIRYFPRGDNSIDHAVEVLRDTTLHPVYVHCKHGHDRCGTVVGLYKVRHHGWSADAAYRDMRQYGFNERLGGLRRYYWSAARRAPAARPASPILRGGERAIAGSVRQSPRATASVGAASPNQKAAQPAAKKPVAAKPVAATAVPARAVAAQPKPRAPTAPLQVAEGSPKP